MSFDKIKAMRNAERFLSQGKIRAAINEYQRIVENDPKDFSTLNILGDLHAKNLNKQEAVGCFTQVAEHYNNQGFSHKAIAIYNKIFRIEPDSMEISAKLAQLYHLKGSVVEARKHYVSLAERYQNKGQKIEALAIWKQIAELDPNNTEIYLKIADTYWQEEQSDDAVWAFVEAGLRFNKQEKYESALTAFSRALDIKNDDLRAIKGLVKAQISLGDAEEAAVTLEKILDDQPYNRDILYLIADCYLEAGKLADAERAIFKLVEQEPANYPKFLELVRLQLKTNNLEAAVRILTYSSEHLLVGGQAEDFLEWTNEILARDPEDTDAMRLLVQYYNWQRDTGALKESLERLVEVARSNGDVEAERYALSQLVLTAPQKENTQRLQEINTAKGFKPDAGIDAENLLQTPQFENFSVAESEKTNEPDSGFAEYNLSDLQTSYGAAADLQTFEQSDSNYDVSSNGNSPQDAHFYQSSFGPEIIEDNPVTPAIIDFETFSSTVEASENELKPADDFKMQKELESVEFYIEQGYQDLAAKALNELEDEFGSHKKITEFRARLNESKTNQPVSTETTPENEELPVNQIPTETKMDGTPSSKPVGFESFDDFKQELDFDSQNNEDTDDRFETHYHLATAYKEMGLLEEAIREFQDAINLVEINDGTRRFFQCANLLGHCFLEKNMPNLSVVWYQRSLEVANLDEQEKHAIFYELGNAFEADGDKQISVLYFEKLYAEDVNYRDVSQRLENLRVANSDL